MRQTALHILGAFLLLAMLGTEFWLLAWSLSHAYPVIGER